MVKRRRIKDDKRSIEGKSSQKVAIKNYISGGMLRNWIIKYNQDGEDSLINKKKPGSHMLKYYVTKNFKSREEELEYENMRLRIENERLKKDTLWKEIVQL